MAESSRKPLIRSRHTGGVIAADQQMMSGGVVGVVFGQQKDETLLPAAPLTTALSSREYLASGIFVGSLIGPEQPRSTLEVGYEIGCGIDMSTSDGVTMGGGSGIAPALGTSALLPGVATGLLPLVSAPVNGLLTAGLKPGLILVVPVVKKEWSKSLDHDQ